MIFHDADVHRANKNDFYAVIKRKIKRFRWRKTARTSCFQHKKRPKNRKRPLILFRSVFIFSTFFFFASLFFHEVLSRDECHPPGRKATLTVKYSRMKYTRCAEIAPALLKLYRRNIGLDMATSWARFPASLCEKSR